MGVATALLAPPTPGVAYVDTPAPGHTGGFGEPTCQACHFGPAPNDPAGSLRLEGIPDRTGPGVTHRLTVVLERPGLVRGGFELSARFADGESAGTLEPLDGRVNVTVVEETGVAYAHHSPQGIRARHPGTLRWELRWTAPTDPSGVVLFHAAANASNADDSALGDSIHLATAETAVRP